MNTYKRKLNNIKHTLYKLLPLFLEELKSQKISITMELIKNASLDSVIFIPTKTISTQKTTTNETNDL